MASYQFITKWRVRAPRQLVWDTLNDPSHFAEWWPCYKSFQILNPNVSGVGSATEYVVRGLLPYDVRHRIEVTHFKPPHEMGYCSTGDLVGDGRMVYEEDERGTLVTFYWNVRTSGFWLNLLAPALRWLFAWNHNWVMQKGEKGLAHWLLEKRPESHSGDD